MNEIALILLVILISPIGFAWYFFRRLPASGEIDIPPSRLLGWLINTLYYGGSALSFGALAYALVVQPLNWVDALWFSVYTATFASFGYMGRKSGGIRAVSNTLYLPFLPSLRIPWEEVRDIRFEPTQWIEVETTGRVPWTINMIDRYTLRFSKHSLTLDEERLRALVEFWQSRVE